jgi:predicted phosphohydrolase
MTVFALSDLHLSFASPKPMDIFGPDWTDHPDKIARNWDALVAPDDIVLVAGDTSWAMKFEAAIPDLEFLAERPGRKILIRGNHDYWWGREATNKIQRAIDPSITLLHGSSTVVDGVGIAGTRGWRLEDIELEGPTEGDRKIYDRELMYLKRALDTLSLDLGVRIAMLHYPPYNLDLRPNEFRAMLDECKVDILVYGHIHKRTSAILEGDVDGITYHLTSADYVNFRPVVIYPSEPTHKS